MPEYHRPLERFAASSVSCFSADMTIAAAQADQFITEAVQTRVVWTVCDDEGFPTSTNASGERAMPFWSKESRAQKIIDTVAAYHGFRPYRIELPDFMENWLPGLERDGLVAGLNWSGKRATGYDMAPKDVRARLAAQRVS